MTTTRITARMNANIGQVERPAYGGPTLVYECKGCGATFDTLRGAHAHQSVRFQTLACQPIRGN